MISGFCISRDWTHFLPPKLMSTELCLWKIWLEIHLCLLFYVGTAPSTWPSKIFTPHKCYSCKNCFKLNNFYFVVIEMFAIHFLLLFIFQFFLILSWILRKFANTISEAKAETIFLLRLRTDSCSNNHNSRKKDKAILKMWKFLKIMS